MIAENLLGDIFEECIPLFIAVAVGAVGVKAVRNVIKAKKQEEDW